MDKITTIENIFQQYKISCARLMRQGELNDIELLFSDFDESNIPEYSIHLLNKVRKAKNDDELFIQQINFVYTLLDNNERKIIMNDFVYKNNKIWYLKHYSRSTYYRIRENAVVKMLKYLGRME